MFIPLGFSQQSIQTNLGYIVYYTNNRPPWNDTETNSKKTLVFLHGLGGGSSNASSPLSELSSRLLSSSSILAAAML